jgi:hypothetical protein
MTTGELDLYVPPTRTRIVPVDLIKAFALAYVEIVDRPADEPAPRRFVELVSAQARHELGDDATTPEDDDVAWCWNLTGLKREAGYPWTTLGTHEVISDVKADALIAQGVAEEERHWHDAPSGMRAVYFKNLGPARSHAATHFRAFRDLNDAAWWSLRKYLVAGSRYATPTVQSTLYDGDARAFAAALKRLGYYTSTEKQYGDRLVDQQAKVRRDSALVDWASLPLMSKRRANELSAMLGMTVQGREVT